MNEPPNLEPLPEDPEEVQKEKPVSRKRADRQSAARPFTFWRGFQTALGAAFVVASLFTLWTPGSLVQSSLEIRMAQALEAASGDPVNVEATLVADPDPQYSNIGIVAGHYGYDSGAVCASGVTEAELNLEIATLVQKKLTDRGYTVDLLEEFDDRLDGYKGRLLISIHLDSCEYVNDLATGFKVAAALSESNVASSQRLITCLSDEYAGVTGLPYHAGSVTEDMTYYHAFSEIDPVTTAAIIEAGFMNMDYRLITEETDLVADGIVAGILCFLSE
jgi:N-acetylmuramoyl-L-alanine amidase